MSGAPVFAPGTRELVLPSGKFATLRPITAADRMVCAKWNGEAFKACIAIRIVSLDDEPINLEDVLLSPEADSRRYMQEVEQMLREGEA